MFFKNVTGRREREKMLAVIAFYQTIVVSMIYGTVCTYKLPPVEPEGVAPETPGRLNHTLTA